MPCPYGVVRMNHLLAPPATRRRLAPRLAIAAAALAMPLAAMVAGGMFAAGVRPLVAGERVEAAPAPPGREPLWQGMPPVAATDAAGPPRPADDRLAAQENAFITVHLPEHPTGAAAVILPGGAYTQLMVTPEGHGIAGWLNRHGIAGIVLEYRMPDGRADVPWLDASRALRTVRRHADEWKIDPDRVGVVGFSAGGHLAATLATRFDGGDPDAEDLVERESSRPDFAILVYPVIMLDESVRAGYKTKLLGADPTPEFVDRFCPERHVTAESPPAFLAHAVDDTGVTIENSERFFAAQRSAGLPATLLRLPDGGHGLNGYRGASWDAWQAGAIEWLRERGILR